MSLSQSLRFALSPAPSAEYDHARFDVDRKRGCAVIHASGEVDIATSPRLSEALSVAADHSPRIVVDLSEVTFLDSTGLNLLVAAYQHARDYDGNVALAGPAGIVRSAIHVTGLQRLFAIHDSLEDAITAVAQ